MAGQQSSTLSHSGSMRDKRKLVGKDKNKILEISKDEGDSSQSDSSRYFCQMMTHHTPSRFCYLTSAHSQLGRERR